MPMYVKTSGNGLDSLKKALNTLKDRRVLVGIPEAQDKPHGKAQDKSQDNLTNVQLAFLMTNGSPLNRIPPRPFLEPAFNEPEAKRIIAREMRGAFLAAANGDESGVETALERAGIAGQNAVKDYMVSGNFVPNAEITIKGGWMRSRKLTITSKKGKLYGKAFKVKGKGSDKPLIDTGNLQGSITYVVE